MSAGAEEKPVVQDLVLSLTGFDEIAIEKAFSTDLETLSAQRQMRALAFILARREGKNDNAAYQHVMEMAQGDVLGLFGIDVDEVMPDEPESEMGKDDSQAELPLSP